jgi:hypothetical protein
MRNFLFGLIMLSAQLGFAQLLPYMHYTERNRDKSDSTTLQSFFRSGEFYGHARYYFMATDNEGELKDFFANAFGMGIGYETAKFKGFQIGLSGFFIYNVFSSDFTILDTKTGIGSRYEIGQFDMLDVKNKHDMDRLEDLYIKYTFKESNIKFGKQHIKSPFINPQDGRMRPTLVEGAMIEYNQVKKLKIEGGWLYNISPRSTVKWFDIGESMSVFPPGLGVDGKPSQYIGNVHSNAVYFGGITSSVIKNTKVQLWNFHIDNVLNSTLIQSNIDFPIKGNNKITTGLQFIQQQAVNHGGNANQSLTYVPHDNLARTFGARVGLAHNSSWSFNMNYNRITSDGRYLMPREWGRDPFFTFMARERNEGYGDVHAMNGTFNKTFGKSGWRAEAGYGQYFLPDVTNVRLNKYGMPSYWQTNIDIRYIFGGFYQGLEMQFLYVYKGQLGQTNGNDKYVMNKVNMSLYNLVINYHF